MTTQQLSREDLRQYAKIMDEILEEKIPEEEYIQGIVGLLQRIESAPAKQMEASGNVTRVRRGLPASQTSKEDLEQELEARVEPIREVIRKCFSTIQWLQEETKALDEAERESIGSPQLRIRYAAFKSKVEDQKTVLDEAELVLSAKSVASADTVYSSD